MIEVSIIMPVYNGENTIEDSIESCLNQSEKNFELIIVDNASTDDTKLKVRKYRKDKRIKYIYTDLRGRSRARNIGIKSAIGKYLIFLDSDDQFDHDMLNKGCSFLKDNDTYFGYAVAVEYISKNNSETNLFIPKSGEAYLMLNNQFPINSILFKNDKLKFFKENIEHNEDWLFFIENLKGKSIYIDDSFVGGKVFVHGNNTMKDLSAMISSKLYIRANYNHLFPKNYSIAFDNLKLLMYSSFLFDKQNRYSINNHFKKQRFLLKGVKQIPYINKFIRKKLESKLQVNQYNEVS